MPVSVGAEEYGEVVVLGLAPGSVQLQLGVLELPHQRQADLSESERPLAPHVADRPGSHGGVEAGAAQPVPPLVLCQPVLPALSPGMFTTMSTY